MTVKNQPSVRVACGVICEHKNKFLMVREQRPGEGLVLNQPVGNLRPGEDLLSAVRRVQREETGYEVEPVALLGGYVWQTPEGNTSIRLCFVTQISDEEASKTASATEDWIQPIWLTREELTESRSSFRNPVTKACFEDYFAGTTFPLTVLKSIGNVS